MYLDKNKIMDSLTKEDVIKVVMALGSEAPRHGQQGELVFQTVCHNAENGHYKLYYYHEPTDKYPGKMFHCYTNCGDSFNIIELIIRAHRAKNRKITFFKALNYLAELTGHVYQGEMQAEKGHLIDDWGFINKFQKTPEYNIPVLKEIS